MRIVHVALGGLIKAPPVAYGLTEDTGGHIAYVLGAAAAQAARPGARVEVVTRRIETPHGPEYAAPREAVAPGLDIVRLDDGDPRYLCKDALAARIPAFARALRAHLAAGPRPDAIHAHFADAAEAARPAAAALGVPLLYTAHSLGIDKREAGGTGAALAARIAREDAAIAGAAAVIASSRDEAERQLALYPSADPARIHRVMPGTDPLPAADPSRAAALLAPFLRDPSRPMVLAIARPVEKKNLSALVEIFAAAPGLADRANLVILAGLRDGVDAPPAEDEAARVHRAIIAAIDRHDLWGRVAIPKRHAPADVHALYAAAARGRGVFANPALTEPFGLTILEAASAGLPTVATANGGPRDILDLVGHGAVADPSDRAAFGAAILRLLTDRAAWDRASAAAGANLPRWTWARYARHHAAIVRDLAPRRAARAAPRHLLVSDVDGTLTGDAGGVARLRLWRAGAPHWRMAFATGRSISEARFVAARWDLPAPDAVAASVGTEIYLPGPAGWRLDAGYAAHIAAGWDRGALARLLAVVPGLVPQDPVEFRAFKLSYYGTAAAAEAARDAIRAAGLLGRVIHSHGRLIDVLPVRAGKAAAMRRLAELLGVPPRAVLAAGDSGNDLDMLQAAPRAVVVANASAELDSLRPRPGLLRAAAPHAAGVLEGVARAEAAARPLRALPTRAVA